MNPRIFRIKTDTDQDGILGDSYTLCGISTVEDDEEILEVEEMKSNCRITCPDCLKTIQHCLFINSIKRRS